MQGKGQNTPEQEKQGFYRPATPSTFTAQPADDDPAFAAIPQDYDHDDTIEWEASEYIHRSKDITWAIGFGLVVLAGIAIAVWLQAWTFLVLVVVMAAAVGVFAFRKPRVKRYHLSHEGLAIDQHIYHLTDFRAFGVLPEDAIFSIILFPTARFKPAVTMYFAREDGEKIVDILGTHLPMQELHPDPVDALMRRLHF